MKNEDPSRATLFICQVVGRGRPPGGPCLNDAARPAVAPYPFNGQRHSTRGKRRSAFTLIEILVVLVIIMILAGIIVGAAKFAQTKAARSRAQAEIATLETALESYKNDNGAYPITPAGRPVTSTPPFYGNSATLYTALTTPKVYMTFKPNQITANGGVTYIVDPFGAPYRYYCTQPVQPDQTNSVSFDLWSYGPDGQNDTADDIVNWRQ